MSVRMRELGMSQLINQTSFLKLFYVGKPIYGKWSDICLLWAKAYWDPQEGIWSTQSVCFCTSSYFAFFVLSMTPPSHRQAARFFFFFWISSNTSICILNMSRKWLPSQLLSLCLADKQRMSVYVTQTKYTSLQIPPCSMCYKVLRHKWVSRKDRISLSILNSGKLYAQDDCQDVFENSQLKNHRNSYAA